ncbi:TetR/AcrR family transcriptional regulator [Saccharopolyspora griseoalba]|uniref:TetR/AcrR family transcriptional regulator n=1 Tax=Saccharopolyspora griseoalba TaxID=1431848 RepID=A0ABW2LGC2_9PSEU
MTDRENRSAQLLWGGRERPARGPKPSLSVDRIVAEGIALADGEGLPALSMQRLATELGVGTMSLYRYVPSKDDLIALMLDAAVGAPPRISARAGWRSAMETWARSCAEVFGRHPWVLSLVARPRTMGPNEVAYVEVALAALSGTGLSPAEKLNTVVLVNGFVRGIAPFVATARATEHTMIDTELIAELGRGEAYPNVTEVMGELAERKPRKSDSPFEYGLRRILDGVAARVDAR